MTTPLSSLERAARHADRVQRHTEAAERRAGTVAEDALSQHTRTAANRAALLWERETQQQRDDAAGVFARVLDGQALAPADRWYVKRDCTSVAYYDDVENGLRWAAYMQATPGSYSLGRLGLGVRRLADETPAGFTPVENLAHLGRWLATH